LLLLSQPHICAGMRRQASELTAGDILKLRGLSLFWRFNQQLCPLTTASCRPMLYVQPLALAILPSLQGDGDLGNVIVPQPYTEDFLGPDKLKAKPSITRLDCRIRVPKVFIRGLNPLIEGVARLESLPVPILKKPHPLPERASAGRVAVEF